MTTAELPVSLCTKYIPASDYLKLTLTGREITEDWWAELDGLLGPHGAVRNDAYIIQAYDERFKGMDRVEESEIRRVYTGRHNMSMAIYDALLNGIEFIEARLCEPLGVLDVARHVSFSTVLFLERILQVYPHLRL